MHSDEHPTFERSSFHLCYFLCLEILAYIFTYSLPCRSKIGLYAMFADGASYFLYLQMILSFLMFLCISSF